MSRVDEKAKCDAWVKARGFWCAGSEAHVAWLAWQAATAKNDQLRADKMAMFEDAKRYAEEAGRLAAELSDARLEIEGLRRDAERLDSGRIILSHLPNEWGNDRTEFCGVDLRKAIDAAMPAAPSQEAQG